jgi:hypothetical protein
MHNLEKTSIELVKPYEKNAKKHPEKQTQQIAASIKEFGFNQAIVVDKDNVVIVGHGRLEAAKLLGLKEVPTLRVDLTEDQAKAYRLADNKLNESDWDMDLVVEELTGLDHGMVELTGFDFDLLDDIGMGTDFSLPDGDKSPFRQITFTLADEQTNLINKTIKKIKNNKKYKHINTCGNENTNGNAIALIVQQWAEQKK